MSTINFISSNQHVVLLKHLYHNLSTNKKRLAAKNGTLERDISVKIIKMNTKSIFFTTAEQVITKIIHWEPNPMQD